MTSMTSSDQPTVSSSAADISAAVTPPPGLVIGLEQPHHAAIIESLNDEAFGPDRQKKTVYRFRDGVSHLPELALVAEDEAGAFRGTLRFWPVMIGQTPALLLGPLTVVGGLRKTGVGTRLMWAGLERAKALGHRIVILVGDEPYYSRFGFRRALAEPLSLPGPVDLARFLALELVPGAMDGVTGMVEKWPSEL
ncbi:GNAT family N-acetyltransferase [Novispirillum itersonii]|uniref:Putative N-acetyltransferase YhbS n=1 Tax=Novispirillum itersonii TaxID=189 RepID=A0A7W9ZK36_NOVIT|nr:N-acetyltransferase [Novispirillum itersonii]MBB6211977.1 putative N-acetyltransferase YhbS [Novispirillum itersonii]